jgi:choline dehydrogenase
VLPYFKRSERYEGGASEFHGGEGELGVSDLRNDHPYVPRLARGRCAGRLRRDRRLQRRQGQRAGRYQLTLAGHWRSSASTAFLRPARGAPT